MRRSYYDPVGWPHGDRVIPGTAWSVGDPVVPFGGGATGEPHPAERPIRKKSLTARPRPGSPAGRKMPPDTGPG